MSTTQTVRRLVSIGLPVFNGGKFLRAALTSLLSQSHTDFELILANNASTDETAAICHEFADRDSRIRLITHPTNIGANANFGRVLHEARGEFFMWAASDDCWHPDFVARLLAELGEKPGAGVAMSAIERVTEDGEIVDVIRFNKTANPNGMNHRALFLAITSPRKTKYNLYIYGLYRRELLTRLFPSLSASAINDRILMAVAALCTQFRYVDEVLQTRMVRTASLEQRYPDEQFVKMQQRGLGGDCETAWHLGRAVLGCDLIPWYRRALALPGMVNVFRLLRATRRRQIKAARIARSRAAAPEISLNQ